MPRTEIRVYRAGNGKRPLADWLTEMAIAEPVIHEKCLAFVVLLRDEGFGLRRPAADLLRDGIYELRPKNGRVNYRMLYFFCGRNVACITHGLTKEKEVPAGEIASAIVRKKQVTLNLNKYSIVWDL